MKEWTIMVYMNADHSDFEDVAKRNFEQLSAIGSTKHINIVVLLDRAAQKDAENQEEFYPKIYVLTKGMKYPPKAKPTLELGKESEGMGSQDTLDQLLNFCVENAPAKKHMLAIWDHGSGLAAQGGFGENIMKQLNQFMRVTSNMSDPMVPRLARIVRQIQRRQFLPPSYLHNPRLSGRNVKDQLFIKNAEGEEDNTPLFVTEIADSLKSFLKKVEKPKLDVMVFDACWMQTLENAYTLKDLVSYVVGSESTFSVSGMGYQQFIEVLNQAPECSAREAGRYLVEATALHQSHSDRLTVSSLALQHTESVTGQLNQLGEALRDAGPDFFPLVRFARFLCLPFHLSEGGFFMNVQVVDLHFFLEKLCDGISVIVEQIEANEKAGKAEPDDLLFMQKSNNLIDVLQQTLFNNQLLLIDHKCIGSKLAIRETNEADKCWGAQGVSIFFPELYVQWKEYKDAKEWYFLTDDKQLPFVIELTGWMAFLDEYFKWLQTQYNEVMLTREGVNEEDYCR